jgi:hypothetical protein
MVGFLVGGLRSLHGCAVGKLSDSDVPRSDVFPESFAERRARRTNRVWRTWTVPVFPSGFRPVRDKGPTGATLMSRHSVGSTRDGP